MAHKIQEQIEQTKQVISFKENQLKDAKAMKDFKTKYELTGNEIDIVKSKLDKSDIEIKQNNQIIDTIQEEIDSKNEQVGQLLRLLHDLHGHE